MRFQILYLEIVANPLKSYEVKTSETLNDFQVFFVEKSDVVCFVDDSSDDRLKVEKVVRNVSRIRPLTLGKRNVKNFLEKGIRKF